MRFLYVAWGTFPISGLWIGVGEDPAEDGGFDEFDSLGAVAESEEFIDPA